MDGDDTGLTLGLLVWSVIEIALVVVWLVWFYARLHVGLSIERPSR